MSGPTFFSEITQKILLENQTVCLSIFAFTNILGGGQLLPLPANKIFKDWLQKHELNVWTTKCMSLVDNTATTTDAATTTNTDTM